MAEREQAERDEEQRQEEDVAAGEGEHNQRDGYADGKGAQHVRLLRLSVAGRGTETPSVPRARRWLLVAGNGLVGVTGARQVVAC
jgi:hypothetical protein